MRSYIAVSIFALSASVLSAPTPQLGLGNVVGSVASTVGTGNLLQGDGNEAGENDVDLSGVTGILQNGKRELNIIGGLTRPVDGLVGDVTKTRVVGNARRQLNIPVVPAAVNIVDGVTQSLNTDGAIKGVNTDLGKRQLTVPVVPAAVNIVDGVTQSLNTDGAIKGVNTDLGKRQLNIPVVAGVTGTLDRVTGSLNTDGAIKGVNTDINSKRQEDIVEDVVGLVTGPVDTITNGLDIGIDTKRGLPVVQDLPVVGGLTSTLDNTPVVGGVTDTVHGVTGDLNPVTSTVFDAVEPVTELTEALDVRSPELVDAGKTVEGVTGTVDGVVNSVL